MSVEVKICGLMDTAGIDAAVKAGARYLGFVFHPSSTRYIVPEDAAGLVSAVPASVRRVGLFVDAKDDDLRAALREAHLDMLQLHGNETPSRVKAIRAQTGLPVMKALRVATADDLKPVAAFEAVSDYLLFDTKIGSEPTGGTGKSFDWTLLQDRHFAKPWMLAGGLKAANIEEAVRVTGAKTLDVSSGVEGPEGRKEAAKIREFIELAASLG